MKQRWSAVAVSLSLVSLCLPSRARPTPSRVASLFSRSIELSACGLLCLFLSPSAFAASVTLAWDPSSDPGAAGYFLYYGYASGSYSVKMDVGNYTTAAVSGFLQGHTYYLAATTYDMYGYESPFSSPEVIVAIPDTAPPAVTITSPLDGASVQKNSTVTISATASDNVGVSKMEFYINGKVTCSDTTSPYTCPWKVPGASGRTYQLQAKAYDGQGNVGSSSIVTVTAK
jgi:chitinase